MDIPSRLGGKHLKLSLTYLLIQWPIAAKLVASFLRPFPTYSESRIANPPLELEENTCWSHFILILAVTRQFRTDTRS